MAGRRRCRHSCYRSRHSRSGSSRQRNLLPGALPARSARLLGRRPGDPIACVAARPRQTNEWIPRYPVGGSRRRDRRHADIALLRSVRRCCICLRRGDIGRGWGEGPAAEPGLACFRSSCFRRCAPSSFPCLAWAGSSATSRDGHMFGPCCATRSKTSLPHRITELQDGVARSAAR